MTARTARATASEASARVGREGRTVVYGVGAGSREPGAGTNTALVPALGLLDM